MGGEAEYRQVQADLPGTLAQQESESGQNHWQEGLAGGGGLWSPGWPSGMADAGALEELGCLGLGCPREWGSSSDTCVSTSCVATRKPCSLSELGTAGSHGWDTVGKTHIEVTL